MLLLSRLLILGWLLLGLVWVPSRLLQLQLLSLYKLLKLFILGLYKLSSLLFQL